MSLNKYPLASTTWDRNELDAIKKVIDSNRYTMGKNVQKFEKRFSKYLKRKYSVMVSSGSAANLISIASLFYCSNPLQFGDEVIVPAVSWSTTYFPLQQFGLRVKFVDIDRHTLNYDLNALKSAISKKTKLIVVVNLLGNPNDFDEIFNIISGKQIKIFEDNCESLGSEYKNKKTGTFGDISTFSTFFSHHISTMEGGFVTTDDEEIFHILLSLRAHGWTRDLPKENLLVKKNSNLFYESFRFILPGYNVRPLEFSGAIGLEQIKKLDKFIKIRRENAKYFQELFDSNEHFIIQEEISESSWFGFSLVIKDSSSKKRDDIVSLLKKNGIESRPIVAGNFTKNEVIKFFNYDIHKRLVNSDLIHNNGFFVGNHHYCLKEQLNMLFEILSN